MKIDGTLLGSELTDTARLVREFEDLGFDGVFTGETTHDPFFPLLLAAEHTRTLELGTNIALGFPRSPMHLANIGYDLQQFSKGRFTLGLGTQVKAHIEKRFSATWTKPVSKMGELVEAVRAVWRCWQNGEKLSFRGDFYTLTIMTPFFDPGPNPFGTPKINLAAVGESMTTMAGKVADGLLIHPFNTPHYVRTVSLPALELGLAESGRTRSDVEVMSQVFVVTGNTEEQYNQRLAEAREQIAFYGSTPAYRPVLEAHGWGQLQNDLNELAKRGQWSDMAGLIDDEILEAFAVVAEPAKVAAALLERYGNLCDRISFYSIARQEPSEWASVLDGFREQK